MLALAALATLSCTKEEPIINGDGSITVTAVTEDFDKTTIDNSCQISWVKDVDAISVFDAAGNNVGKFIADNSGKKVTFTCKSPNPKVGIPAYAVYPYDEKATCDASGNVSTSINANQDGTIASSVLASKLNDGKFVFAPVCSVIKMTIKASDNISTADVRIDGTEKVAGAVKIACAGTTPVITSATDAALRFCPDNKTEEKAYYVSVKPSTVAKIDLTFTRADGAVATKTATLKTAFPAGHLKDIGTVNALYFKKSSDPDINVTKLITADITAGYPDVISIDGKGFDASKDAIFVGWGTEPNITYEQVNNASLAISSTNIKFGLNPGTAAGGKTVKIYLQRQGYNKTLISRDVTVKTPTLMEDGYISDATLVSELCSKNPAVKAMTNILGLVNPTSAKALKNDPSSAKGTFNISSSAAKDWSGLCLFQNLGLTKTYLDAGGMEVAAFSSNGVTDVDLSAWEAPVLMNCNSSSSMKSFVAGKKMYGANLSNCSSLKKVDMHTTPWARTLDITGNSVTYLDIRRYQGGTIYVDYAPMFDASTYKLNGIANSATILVDAYYLIHHNVNA